MNKVIGISTLVLAFCWSISFFLTYGMVPISQVIVVFIVLFFGIRTFLK